MCCNTVLCDRCCLVWGDLVQLNVTRCIKYEKKKRKQIMCPRNQRSGAESKEMVLVLKREKKIFSHTDISSVVAWVMVGSAR